MAHIKLDLPRPRGDAPQKAASSVRKWNDPGLETDPELRWWHAVLCGLLHAVLMAAAFPPVGFWLSVFAAPLPLLWLAVRAPKLNRAAWLACLGVLPLWLFEMSYVIPISSAGYVPMAVYLASTTWLFVVPMGMVTRAWPRLPLGMTFPVMWIAMEVLRGDVILDGLPWFYLAHPLIEAKYLAFPARLFGAAGVSLLVACAAGGFLGSVLAAETPRERLERNFVGIGAVVWALAIGFSKENHIIPKVGDGAPIRVAIVQTNLPQNNKTYWTFPQRLTFMGRLEELTRKAAEGRPDFIVWPETMFPGINLDEASLRAQERAGLFVPVPGENGKVENVSVNVFATRLFELQKSVGIPMIVGAIGADEPRVEERNGGYALEAKHRYNSAFVVNHGWVEPERFDKIALTPFGEYMPVIGNWPWLQDKLLALGARGMAFDLASGKKYTPLTLDLGEDKPRVRFAAPICFEVTREETCRRLVFEGGTRRANLLVNLTNDGWFAFFKAGRLQHLQLARWRCLELGTPMARAANTGLSAIIDTLGRVIASGIDGDPSATEIDGVLSGVIPNIVEDTPYARFGDWVSYPVLSIAGLGTAAAWVVGRRRRGSLVA